MTAVSVTFRAAPSTTRSASRIRSIDNQWPLSSEEAELKHCVRYVGGRPVAGLEREGQLADTSVAA